MSPALGQLWALLESRPALLATGLFLAITVFLGVLFAVLMRRSGASLRPLVWLFGFMGLVAGPQFTVHLLDEAMALRAAPPAQAAAATPALQAVSWPLVFGPQADPDLIVDGRRAAPGVLDAAQDARLAFSRRGGSALAARFASSQAAHAALDAYGAFFRFGNASGSDAVGWTAQRYDATGEWNHIVVAGRELYAWTGPTRESVLAERERTLGPVAAVPSALASDPGAATGHLTRNPAQLAAFVAINLLAVVLWFFKGSAWAAREAAEPGVVPAAAGMLEQRLLALNRQDQPVAVSRSADGRTLAVDWRYADAPLVRPDAPAPHAPYRAPGAAFRRGCAHGAGARVLERLRCVGRRRRAAPELALAERHPVFCCAARARVRRAARRQRPGHRRTERRLQLQFAADEGAVHRRGHRFGLDLAAPGLECSARLALAGLRADFVTSPSGVMATARQRFERSMVMDFEDKAARAAAVRELRRRVAGSAVR